MTDLFSGQEAPLADRMRPRTLAEFIGQRHLLGEGRLLRRAHSAAATLLLGEDEKLFAEIVQAIRITRRDEMTVTLIGGLRFTEML